MKDRVKQVDEFKEKGIYGSHKKVTEISQVFA